MKILHITVHLGAGAGKAITGMAVSDQKNVHRIIVLDMPEKRNHIERCMDEGIEVLISPSTQQVREAVNAADVVVVNWWHHPLLYQTLTNVADIPARIALWSHVNGLTYPYLNFNFLEMFDSYLFTSSVSLLNNSWSIEEKKYVKKNAYLVYGMGEFYPERLPYKKSYEIENKQNVRIGYVGSLDYAKLHPKFAWWVKACIEKYPYIHFELAGDVTKSLVEDIDSLGIADNITLLGFREDIKEILPSWDAFIYFLNPMNFATTENALIEAMASGLPIITSDGVVEKTIITSSENGFCVKDEEEFIKVLESILFDETLRERIGKKARADAIETYNLDTNIHNFNSAMNKLMIYEKEEHAFQTAIGWTSFDWFISGCGEEDSKTLIKLLADYSEHDMVVNLEDEVKNIGKIFRGNSKGSVMQYSRCYPNDQKLKKLSNILNLDKE